MVTMQSTGEGKSTMLQVRRWYTTRAKVCTLHATKGQTNSTGGTSCVPSHMSHSLPVLDYPAFTSL